jgi:hypothetical protein
LDVTLRQQQQDGSAPPATMHYHYQLLGMTCLELAIKVHDTKIFPLEELVRMGGGGSSSLLTPAQVVAMEAHLVKQMKWKLHPPTPHCFVHQYGELLQALLMEVDVNVDVSPIVDKALQLVRRGIYQQLTQPPSVLAYAALLAAMQQQQQQQHFSIPSSLQQSLGMYLWQWTGLSAQSPGVEQAYRSLVGNDDHHNQTTATRVVSPTTTTLGGNGTVYTNHPPQPQAQPQHAKVVATATAAAAAVSAPAVQQSLSWTTNSVHSPPSMGQQEQYHAAAASNQYYPPPPQVLQQQPPPPPPPQQQQASSTAYYPNAASHQQVHSPPAPVAWQQQPPQPPQQQQQASSTAYYPNVASPPMNEECSLRQRQNQQIYAQAPAPPQTQRVPVFIQSTMIYSAGDDLGFEVTLNTAEEAAANKDDWHDEQQVDNDHDLAMDVSARLSLDSAKGRGSWWMAGVSPRNVSGAVSPDPLEGS